MLATLFYVAQTDPTASLGQEDCFHGPASSPPTTIFRVRSLLENPKHDPANFGGRIQQQLQLLGLGPLRGLRASTTAQNERAAATIKYPISKLQLKLISAYNSEYGGYRT